MVERDQEWTEQQGREQGRVGRTLSDSELGGQVPADVRDVSFHVAVRGYERREVDRYVRRVNQVIAELEIARSPESAVRHALDRVGEQTSGILQRARETADEIIHTARSEAEEVIERGQAEAREIESSVRAEAQSIVAEAQGEATDAVRQGQRELASAREQATKTREEADAALAAAQSRADESVAEAKREAEQIVTRADAQAIDRRAREEQRLDELRRGAELEVQVLRADVDAISGGRSRLVEEIHELAARLDALADGGPADATRDRASEDGSGSLAWTPMWGG